MQYTSHLLKIASCKPFSNFQIASLHGGVEDHYQCIFYRHVKAATVILSTKDHFDFFLSTDSTILLLSGCRSGHRSSADEPKIFSIDGKFLATRDMKQERASSLSLHLPHQGSELQEKFQILLLQQKRSN